jgi:soluble lytic murein transglycosylase-like protein
MSVPRASPMQLAATSRRRGHLAAALVAIVLSAGAAGGAMASGIAMIVGGMRAPVEAHASSARGVVLTFGIGEAALRTDEPKRVDTKNRTHLRMMALAPLVAGIAHAQALDGALLMAVIHAESAGDPLALSPKGATGLMQLMPATGAEYGAADLFDARQNIEAGARFLGELLKRYGSRDLALAAYNAGAGAVDRYNGRIPPYDETQRYVVKVNSLYACYTHADTALRQAALAADTGGVPAKWMVVAP